MGFRNETELDDADYVLIGDSFIHSTNITQKKILNYVLKDEFNINSYNAGMASTDISHYFETIKFFKKKNEARR